VGQERLAWVDRMRNSGEEPRWLGCRRNPVLVVDTAPIIYWLEDTRGSPHGSRSFHAAESGDASSISTVTLAEVLAGPIASGDELRTAQYREALTRGLGWQWRRSMQRRRSKARIRSAYRLRLPDAIRSQRRFASAPRALITHDSTCAGWQDFGCWGQRGRVQLRCGQRSSPGTGATLGARRRYFIMSWALPIQRDRAGTHARCESCRLFRPPPAAMN
jgi:hypothetical protein